jgi:GGDEF domain-containing protein
LRIGGEGADLVLPSCDGTAAEVARLPVGEGWRIIRVSSEVKVNGEALDGARELATRDRIEIAGMGFVFLGAEASETSYHELIYRMTITDFETQCHNARYFREALEREEIRARRHQVPLCVAVLDFGSMGDRASVRELLKESVDRLSAAIPRDWVLARLTEHELGVIAPETTEGPLIARMERPFQRSKWPVPGQEQPLPRPRIGTATLSPEMTAAQLVEKARAVFTSSDE